MYISCLIKKNFSYWFQSLAQSKPHTTPLWQTVIAKGGWPQATEGRVGALSKKHFWHSLKIPKLTLNHKWRWFLNSPQGWVEHSLSGSYPRGKLHTVPMATPFTNSMTLGKLLKLLLSKSFHLVAIWLWCSLFSCVCYLLLSGLQPLATMNEWCPQYSVL